jgi:hypothetical protein
MLMARFASRTAADGLLGGPDEDFVHAAAGGLGDCVDDGVRDVLRLQDLQVQEAAEALSGVLVGDVDRELGLDGPGSTMLILMLSWSSSSLRPSEMAWTANLVPA